MPLDGLVGHTVLFQCHMANAPTEVDGAQCDTGLPAMRQARGNVVAPRRQVAVRQLHTV